MKRSPPPESIAPAYGIGGMGMISTFKYEVFF